MQMRAEVPWRMLRGRCRCWCTGRDRRNWPSWPTLSFSDTRRPNAPNALKPPRPPQCNSIQFNSNQFKLNEFLEIHRHQRTCPSSLLFLWFGYWATGTWPRAHFKSSNIINIHSKLIQSNQNQKGANGNIIRKLIHPIKRGLIDTNWNVTRQLTNCLNN